MSSEVDLLERSLLALAEARVTAPARMRELLGIPDSMTTMVIRSLDQLRSYGYLTEGYLPTNDGRQVLRDEEFLAKDFKQGWLLYDLVRGGIFPVVHDGRLPFFQAHSIEQLKPMAIAPQVSLPGERQLILEASSAVAAYNRRLSLFEALDEEDLAGEERELDVPTISYVAERVEDVQLLSLDLAENHHLLVEVTGQVWPGQSQPELHAYSVFSGWEQDSYLESLKALKDFAVRSELKSLERRAAELAQESILGESGQAGADIWSMLSEKIATTLGTSIRLPDSLVERLHACEYQQVQAQEPVRQNSPLMRESVLSGWAIFLEAALKSVTDEIKNWVIPLNWRQLKLRNKDKAIDWYCNLVKQVGRSSTFLNLPQGIRNNVGAMLIKGLAETFGQLWCSSSRDEIVKVLLANLIDATVMLPPYCRHLLSAAESDAALLSGLDEIVDWRNDCAHGGIKINQLSDEEFSQVLEEVRLSVYRFLRATFIR